jgi:elongation factor G
MIGAIPVVDCAAVCINAHDGIQLNTRRAMSEAEKAGIARMIVITKLDDPQADYKTLFDQCRELWGNGVVPIQVPIGQGESFSDVASTIDLPGEARDAVMNLALAHEQLVEKLVETDESMMEQYFDGVMPEPASL